MEKYINTIQNIMFANKINVFSIVYFVLGLILFTPTVSYADCVNPAGVEPDISYSSTYNVPMFCNGSQWVLMGAINPGAGGAGCTTNTAGIKPEGHIFYNEDYHTYQYCDGDDWQILGVGSGVIGGGFLSFTDLTDQPTSTQVTSNILQVSSDGSISITGDGSPEYRICADDTCSSETQTWGSTAGTITSGDFLQLRSTTSGTSETTRIVTIAVNSASDQWEITTATIDSCIGTTNFTTVGTDTFTIDSSNDDCVYTITVLGGGGGGGASGTGGGTGGDGGGTQFDWSPPSTGTLDILVGGGGGAGNGSGVGTSGIASGGEGGNNAGGGGAASAIKFGATVLAVAGGGGGGGSDTGKNGGDGGSLNNAGGDGTDSSGQGGNGGTGGQSHPSAGGGDGGSGGGDGETNADGMLGGTGNAPYNVSGGGGGDQTGSSGSGGGGGGYGGGGVGDDAWGSGGGGGYLNTGATSNSSAAANSNGGAVDSAGGDGSISITLSSP